jgi:GNAT superfamily N-acetyltransferase
VGTADIAIRTARPDDGDRLWPLVAAFAVSYRPRPDAFARSLDQLLGRDDTVVLVAEDGAAGRIVGYLLASHHGTFFANGPVAWVEEVMVDEAARGTGVGRRLMQAAERWADGAGVAYVALASRRAGAFYLALGYEDSATYFKRELSAGATQRRGPMPGAPGGPGSS